MRTSSFSEGTSLLPALASGGIRRASDPCGGAADKQLCLRLPSLPRLMASAREQGSGGSPCTLALFIWAVDIAWRKEQRNVELGSASSSGGSAQLKLRNCFYLFVTVAFLKAGELTV